MERGLVPISFAAAYLGIGWSKTYELLLPGKLRSVTIGRRRLVPVAGAGALRPGAYRGGTAGRRDLWPWRVVAFRQLS